MKPLRVLSLWQPWATLMAIGAKSYETRSWSTKYTGLVAIHAAKRPVDVHAIAAEHPFGHVLGELVHRLPLGKVVAVGRLAQCYDAHVIQAAIWARIEEYGRGPETEAVSHELAFGDYEAGRFAWHFVTMFALPEPIALRASQGLFNASGELRAAILDQLPALKGEL